MLSKNGLESHAVTQSVEGERLEYSATVSGYQEDRAERLTSTLRRNSEVGFCRSAAAAR
jgi:hypothetical protein